MAKKSGLGNVFDGLFDDDGLFGEDSGALTSLKINEIEPNRNQPRKDFDNEKLSDLAASIAKHGIIQPLIVRPFGESYQIVAGERRWRAARIAGLSEIPVRVMELSDSVTMQFALIENLQREDLNPIEEALGYRELIEKYDIKQEDVAKAVGKARSSVTNALRLLTLPEEVIDMVRAGELSKGHCKALMSAKNEKEMILYANKTKNGGLSVHALEKLIKNTNDERLFNEKGKTIKETFYIEAEISLAEAIGKPVRINKAKNKITLEIDVTTDEELKEIINKLGVY
ncbi:MAG: ParB/RepB/Spo0J family partition protein [Eubacterium sp.]|jgi:ParB family chromosome partitioning protein|nr:ParB/RepB/Spo0J family partition protein [Eubacterium sp.]